MKSKYNRRHGWTSLRTADAFPVVASLGICDDRKCVCCSQAMDGQTWRRLNRTETVVWKLVILTIFSKNMKSKYNRRHGWTSLRTADAFPVVASLGICDDRKCVCCSQAMDGQTWRRLNRTETVVWKLVMLTIFSKFIFVVCNVWYIAWETYLFDTKLWFGSSDVCKVF